MKRILVSFSSNYTIRQITLSKLEVFHTCKNPGNYFDELWVFNLLAFSQGATSGHGLSWKYQKLDTNVHMIEITGSWKIFNAKTFPTLKNLRILLSNMVGIEDLDYFPKYTKLIRAEDALFNGMLGLLLARLIKIPLLVGMWGNPKRIREQTKKPLMPKLFRYRWVESLAEKFVLRRAAMVAVENDENMSYPLSIGVPPENISIFGLGLMMHQSHFLPPESRKARKEFLDISMTHEHIWISISRVEELKYIRHYPYIVRKVVDALPDSLFVLIGSGSDLDYLQEEIEFFGLENNFLILENLDQEAISELASLARVQSALLCGRSLLELSLAALPCVAYKVDWHEEIVLDGITGYLVAVGDRDAISRKVIDLLSNQEVAQLMGIEMRKLALNKVRSEMEKSMIVKTYAFLTSSSSGNLAS